MSARTHVHILGICGTFMGGLAAIARAAGFAVTGSDRNVYPPMSTQLEALGISLTEGFDAAQLAPAPDVVVVGNVMTRGQPVVEALLESGLPYLSGPEWLAREVLRDRWVLAVAGTHGKTTSASLLAWILEHLEAREVLAPRTRADAPARLRLRAAREALERRPAAHRQRRCEVAVGGVPDDAAAAGHGAHQVVELALDGRDVRIDVGVVELEVVEDQGARAVVNELRALVEERGVVLVGLDHEESPGAKPRADAEVGR